MWTSDYMFQNETLGIDREQLRDAENSFRIAADMASLPGANMSWQKNKLQLSAGLPRAAASLVEKMNSQTMIDVLEKMTGIRDLVPDGALHGGGMHFMRRGSRLDMHVDFTTHKYNKELYRRLNLILFLNTNWNAKMWGGELEIWNRLGSSPEAVISPKAGRVVIFETTGSSWHAVRKVKCPEYEMRKTIALYYYSPHKPEQWEDLPTTFKARPGEWYKEKLLWPVERQLHRIKQFGWRLKEELLHEDHLDF